MPPGNTFVTLALLLLFPSTIAAFALWRPPVATAVIMFGAFLFLPEHTAFTIPLVPAMTKYRLATLCCLLAQFVTAQRAHRQARLMRGREWLILLAIPIGQLGTLLTNLSPSVSGGAVLPPMLLKEFIPNTIEKVLDYAGPFLLGRLVYRNAQDGYLFLKAFAVSGVLYVPLVLIELKHGPVCHPWLYGYLQHSLEQAIRGEGFRPMVFQTHGLACALLMSAATTCCWILTRSANQRIIGLPALFVAIGLLILFPFLKSSAALVYTVVGVTVIMTLSPKRQSLIASTICVLVWLYLILRLLGWLPVWWYVNQIARISPDRAYSLGYRFYNETLLMDRAAQHAIFGWGGWGRNFVYDETGALVSTTDGAWIIYYGSGGIVMLALAFLLLTLPVFLVTKRLARVEPAAQPILGGLSVILALNTADLLPNGMFNYQQIFIAGVLAGLAWGMPEEKGKSWLPLLAAWYWVRQRVATGTTSPSSRNASSARSAGVVTSK